MIGTLALSLQNIQEFPFMSTVTKCSQSVALCNLPTAQILFWEVNSTVVTFTWCVPVICCKCNCYNIGGDFNDWMPYPLSRLDLFSGTITLHSALKTFCTFTKLVYEPESYKVAHLRQLLVKDLETSQVLPQRINLSTRVRQL